MFLGKMATLPMANRIPVACEVNMGSQIALQICLALAMLVVLIAALWPKLACGCSEGERPGPTRKFPPADPVGSTIAIRHGHRVRYSESVRQSYERFVPRLAKFPETS